MVDEIFGGIVRELAPVLQGATWIFSLGLAVAVGFFMIRDRVCAFRLAPIASWVLHLAFYYSILYLTRWGIYSAPFPRYFEFWSALLRGHGLLIAFGYSFLEISSIIQARQNGSRAC